MKSFPKQKQILTAYFFVALAIAIFLYGIYILLNSSVDERMKDYERRKRYREQTDKKRADFLLSYEQDKNLAIYLSSNTILLIEK
jgi:hypothetical protein